MSGSEVRVYGVRHHGPGSARALLAALAGFAPDCVLVEGPPDADALIPWLAHPALILPVALLVYCPDEPRRATFYPFAHFSPEYRALRYALDHDVAVGFMDLPRRHMLAVDTAAAMPSAEMFDRLAAAAGRPGYEAWWNETVEQRQEAGALFDAVLEMVTEMREAAGAVASVAGGPSPLALRLANQREAAMRQRIRAAAAMGSRRIAAVCGAWHAPSLRHALTEAPDEDVALLRDLPAIEVAGTWIPWTYGRLTQAGGYGAGVASPGWYDHLWAMSEAGGQFQRNVGMVWLANAARLLRDEGFDTSPGHLIEAVRLAEALAALRGRPFPALDELDEATQSVLCGGDAEPMALIRRWLIVGERMGTVPPAVPVVPLQRDLRDYQMRLNLWPQPEPERLLLDLRQETDLARSRLLHRLGLLEIPWGTPPSTKEKSVGTFNEVWQLQWRPELSLKVIEAAMWGNTVRDAAGAFVGHLAGRTEDLPELIGLIDRAVLADLPEAIASVLARIEEQSAAGTDVTHMLAALPPLAQVLRYGGLRQTSEHQPLLRRVFDHLLTRACLWLPRAAVAIDEAAASALAEHLAATAPAVHLAADARATERWTEALLALADRRGIHAIVAGRATRLLHEAGAQPRSAIGPRLTRALSGGSPAEVHYAADWLEGLLRESGLLLVHDRALSDEIDVWLAGLPGDRFVEVLPLLRRTFADYPENVREQLRRQLERRPAAMTPYERRPANFDVARAATMLPVIARLLGIALPAAEDAQ